MSLGNLGGLGLNMSFASLGARTFGAGLPLGELRTRERGTVTRLRWPCSRLSVIILYSVMDIRIYMCDVVY